MSTIEAAKDMDILRAALGERQLDYLGASYGTLLGATYADLFPHNVRRMVLDGALDPTLTNEQLNLGQARGFETALTAYVAVLRRPRRLRRSATTSTPAKKRIRQLLDSLDSKPLPTGERSPAHRGPGRFGVVLPALREDALAPPHASPCRRPSRTGDGDQLLALADQYAARGPDGYNSNEFTERSGRSTASTTDDSVPSDQMPSTFTEFEKASPTFGRLFVYDLAKCADWPVKSTAHARADPRPGCAADRGHRYDARPGHAVRLGQGARHSSSTPGT